MTPAFQGRIRSGGAADPADGGRSEEHRRAGLSNARDLGYTQGHPARPNSANLPGFNGEASNRNTTSGLRYWEPLGEKCKFVSLKNFITMKRSGFSCRA
jgi:hypothetical protein